MIVAIEEIKLIGLALKQKTSNLNGQSHLDCTNLCHQFTDGKLAEIIPDKVSDDIFGVYFDHEGDTTKPFNYFIGCKVHSDSADCKNLQTLTIPAGNYFKIIVKGKMPDCMVDAWKNIWNEEINRAYQIDFEVYDERSKDWNEAEVDIYLSVK